MALQANLSLFGLLRSKVKPRAVRKNPGRPFEVRLNEPLSVFILTMPPELKLLVQKLSDLAYLT